MRTRTEFDYFIGSGAVRRLVGWLHNVPVNMLVYLRDGSGQDLICADPVKPGAGQAVTGVSSLKALL